MRIPHTSIIIATDTPGDKPLIPAIERAIEASVISKLNPSRALQVPAEFGMAGRVQAETLMSDGTHPDRRYRDIARGRMADAPKNTKLIYLNYEPDEHDGTRTDSVSRPFRPAEMELLARSLTRLRIEAHEAGVISPKIGAWNLPGVTQHNTNWDAVNAFDRVAKPDFRVIHGYSGDDTYINHDIGMFRRYAKSTPLVLAITPKPRDKPVSMPINGWSMGHLARKQRKNLDGVMVWINASWLNEGISAESITEWLDGYAKGITQRWWKK